MAKVPNPFGHTTVRGEKEMKNAKLKTYDESCKLSLGLTLTLAFFTPSANAQQLPNRIPAQPPTRPCTSPISPPARRERHSDRPAHMLPNSKLFYVPSQSALSIRGTQRIISRPEIVSDLEPQQKDLSPTYTIKT